MLSPFTESSAVIRRPSQASSIRRGVCAVRQRDICQHFTQVGDRRKVTVRLTGKVNRSDFGATGWSDLVNDEVRIVITGIIDVKS